MQDQPRARRAALERMRGSAFPSPSLALRLAADARFGPMNV